MADTRRRPLGDPELHGDDALVALRRAPAMLALLEGSAIAMRHDLDAWITALEAELTMPGTGGDGGGADTITRPVEAEAIRRAGIVRQRDAVLGYLAQAYAALVAAHRAQASTIRRSTAPEAAIVARMARCAGRPDCEALAVTQGLCARCHTDRRAA